jgi:hypothetical protein
MVVPWLSQLSCWRCGLVADVGGTPKPGIWESPLFWTSLSLVGVLLLGALIIAIVDRWRKRPVQTTAPPGEQLSQFRSLYERGELSQEEFDRIRARLGGRLREQLKMPAPKSDSAPVAGKQAESNPQPSPEAPEQSGPKA